MVRKTFKQIMHERLGGEWTYDFQTDTWTATDGRHIYKVDCCECWMIGYTGICRCPPKFHLVDENGNEVGIVDVSDKKNYRRNGKGTRKWEF